MIKLYGNPHSRANRVRWSLEHLGLEYEELIVELGEGGTDSDSFRAINPNARVPVLDDNGLVLFESVPICLYLAKKYGADVLYVDSVEQEAQLLQWSVWAMTELEHNIEIVALNTVLLSEDKRDISAASAAQLEVARCIAMLEKQLTANGFMVAERFTIADLIVCEVLTNVSYSGVGLNDFPQVAAFIRRHLTQDSAQRAFAADILATCLD